MQSDIRKTSATYEGGRHQVSEHTDMKTDTNYDGKEKKRMTQTRVLLHGDV